MTAEPNASPLRNSLWLLVNQAVAFVGENGHYCREAAFSQGWQNACRFAHTCSPPPAKGRTSHTLCHAVRVWLTVEQDVTQDASPRRLIYRAGHIHRRLEALEQRLTSEPVTLIMPDGRTETLRGDCISELLSGACRGERTPQMELLSQSIASTEPGGGHLLDLARAILNSPVDQAE